MFTKSKQRINQHNTEHLIIISVDALNAKDYKQMKELSYFSLLMENGSIAKEAVGVYPSLTYPSHVSIITGANPKKHGIYDNKPSNPYQPDVPWFFYDKDIKVKTLYKAAKELGYITSSFFWPVTAGAKIDYNCPPIWPTYKKENQVFLSLKSGSPLFLFEIDRKFGWLRNGLKYPNLDNFTAISAAYVLKKHKPNLLMVAFSELDYERHTHGFNSDEASISISTTNERVGLIIQAAKDAGIFDKTTFVILGDHGFLDYEKHMAPNRLFKDNGLIKTNSQGQIIGWSAYAHSAGGSAQIYLRDPNDNSLKEKVLHLLQNLRKNKNNGIEKIYSKQEAEKKGVVGDFTFVIEAKKGYHFILSANAELVAPVTKVDNEVATHGYDPKKNDYRTITIFSGAGIKKGVELSSIDLIDVAPTLAQLIGTSLPEADGRVLNKVLL